MRFEDIEEELCAKIEEKDKEIERQSKMLINRDKELLKFDDELDKKSKEIERLNNRVKQLEKSIMISNKKHSFMTKDNIKLRTIINEFENYIKESCWKDDWGVESIYVKTLLNKLQELKGDESDEKI